MTDRHIKGLLDYNENLNKVVCESLQTALLKLLKEKEYKKISITELCKKAGVSRMAFYNNYQTLDNLLEDVVLEYNKSLIINDFGSPFRHYTDKNWYIKLFRIVKENSDFLTTLFNAGFKYRYLSIINSIVLHNPNIPAAEKYLRVIWAGGIVNAIIYWLENGMQESVEEISEFCFADMTVKK